MFEFEVDLRAQLFDVASEESDVFLHGLAERTLPEFECLDGVGIFSLAAHLNI